MEIIERLDALVKQGVAEYYGDYPDSCKTYWLPDPIEEHSDGVGVMVYPNGNVLTEVWCGNVYGNEDAALKAIAFAEGLAWLRKSSGA